MNFSVYMAMSLDGFIATEDGGVDWLQQTGDQSVDMSEFGDLGFSEFINSVDAMIMGRNTMQVIADMNLTPEQWPYGELPIYVLSRTLTKLPANLPSSVVLRSSLAELLLELKAQNVEHVYVDGGKLINTCLDKQLITSLQLTQLPIILGKGIRLFSQREQPINLNQLSAKVYPNNFLTVNYQLQY